MPPERRRPAAPEPESESRHLNTRIEVRYSMTVQVKPFHPVGIEFCQSRDLAPGEYPAEARAALLSELRDAVEAAAEEAVERGLPTD